MARDELIVGIGADTSDLQSEIRRAARDIENLSEQLASVAAGADSGPVLQDLIQGIEEAGREMATTAEQTAAVNQLLAELRTGGQQAATGADAMARGFASAAQQQSTLSAETRAWLATNAKQQVGFAEAARQAQALATATAQIETSTQRMSRAFQESAKQAQHLSREIRNTIAGNEAWARGMANMAAQNAGFATSTGKASRGLNMLRGGLASTVASTLSLQSSLASMSQGLLFALGASGGTIVGVLAGLFAATKAYEAFTENSRKAKEETDKLAAALDRLGESFQDPGDVAKQQFEAQRKVVQALAKDLADLTALQAQGPLEQGQPDAVLARQIRRAEEMKRLQADLAKETQRLATAATNVGNISTDTDDARIDRATQLLALGIASRAEQDLLAQQLAKLRSDEAKLAGQDEETQNRRLKIRQQILAIEQLQQKAVELDTKPAQEAAKQLREEVQATANALNEAQAAAAGLSQPFTLRLDVGAALDDIRALQTRVDEMIARFQRLGLGTSDLEGLRDALRKTLAEADPTSLNAVAQAVETLSQRLSVLREDLGGASGQQDALRGTTALLVQEYGKLVGEIERQGGALSASTALLEQAGKAVAALGPDSAPFTAGLGDAITQLREAEQRLREFAEQGKQFPIIEAALQVDVETARAQVAAFLAESQARLDQRVFKAVLNVEIEEGTTSTEFMLKALRASGQEGEKLAKAMEDVNKEGDQFSKTADAIFRAADGFAALTSGIQGLSDDTQEAIDGVLQLTEAAARFAQGDFFGAAVGALNALGIPNALFGKSEAEQESDRIQAENNERLQELRDEISGLTTSIQSLATAQAAIASLSASDIETARSFQKLPGVGVDLGLDFLNQKLEAFGTSLEELDRIAEANDLDLLDDKGRLAADALAVLEEVLGITIDEITNFGTSLADQRSILETRDALAGPDETGLGGLERDRELLLQNLNLGEALEREIAALDLSDAGGQDAFRKFLQDLFDQGLTGFDPSVLEGEITAKDVLEIIKGSADALNELGETAREVSDQMLNVPTGFKGALDAIRFAAEDATVGMQAVPGMPLVPVMAGDGASLPLLREALDGLQGAQFNAPITIEVDGKGKDLSALAKEIVKELRNLSQAKFGTTDRWSEL